MVVFITRTHRSAFTPLISHDMKSLSTHMKPIIINVSTYDRFRLSARTKPLETLTIATNNYVHVYTYKLSTDVL
jgi:hypothetical protein